MRLTETGHRAPNGVNATLRDPVRARASAQEGAELRAFQRRCWRLVALAPVAAAVLFAVEVDALLMWAQLVAWWRVVAG